MIIFFVSALAHEYVISVSLKRISFWAFLGMFAQFFIIICEKAFFKVGLINQVFKLRDSQVGNFSFWISFCIVGQPALIVAYYADYISTFGVPKLPTVPELPL